MVANILISLHGSSATQVVVSNNKVRMIGHKFVCGKQRDRVCPDAKVADVVHEK